MGVVFILLTRFQGTAIVAADVRDLSAAAVRLWQGKKTRETVGNLFRYMEIYLFILQVTRGGVAFRPEDHLAQAAYDQIPGTVVRELVHRLLQWGESKVLLKESVLVLLISRLSF